MTIVALLSIAVTLCSAQDIKEPNVAGTFYPDNAQELSSMIDGFLQAADPQPPGGEIFALISPHAGLGYSGQIAAYGYKLIKGKPYKTVIIIAPSHQFGFSGISVYPAGSFRTPLGDVQTDREFAQKLLGRDEEIFFEPRAFQKEHSIEVQLPFLQKTLPTGFSATQRSGPANNYGWKIVPIVMGDCPLSTCRKLSELLKAAIGDRKDVLVIASSDMYHGYDYEEAELVDKLTYSYLKNMDAEGLYYAIREGRAQACGGFPVVTTIMLAKALGHNKMDILKYTNSCEVTGKKTKGIWTVGYGSCVIDSEKGEQAMLNKRQRKRLLEIARNSIKTYLATGRKSEVQENDPLLQERMGAFVTLNEDGRLRGCIGNLTVGTPLYLTVRDMAVEAAVGDPRFTALRAQELDRIDIEISVLSPLERVDSAERVELGRHGVVIRRGGRSGVFLPQVATETGWTKEEFLSSLCAHKAGLAADAWKDKETEIYVFTAEVFSEQDFR
ncbi:MAG: AmmeMemoRadiSam system protein B [Candidatus Omnitrophota bacterium]